MDKSKKTQSNLHPLSPGLGAFAQATTTASLKLGILAWARPATVALCELSLGQNHLAWARSSLAQNQRPSPGRGHEHRAQLVSSSARLGEPLSPARDGVSLKTRVVAWARSSSRTRASFSYSHRSETSSLGREWQYSPPLLVCSKTTTQNSIQECKQASFIRSIISFKYPKYSTDQKHRE